jgi:tol-pal system protein YbgF
MRRTGASRSFTAAEPGRRARAAAAVLAVAVSAAASAQSRGERIETLEERMGVVERQLEGQGLLEMARQLELMQQDLRRLRGELDELRHELERTRSQQRDQYVDLDTRLRAAEAALAAAQSAVPAASPEAEYQAAFNLLKDGRYDDAAAALQDFLVRHPTHELASNALYWLGEAHYVRRDFTAALAAFEGVLRDYPGARKSPDAMLKAGYCQHELKRPAQARAMLGRLVNEYPDTQAAAEARARIERLDAEGR